MLSLKQQWCETCNFFAINIERRALCETHSGFHTSAMHNARMIKYETHRNRAQLGQTQDQYMQRDVETWKDTNENLSNSSKEAPSAIPPPYAEAVEDNRNHSRSDNHFSSKVTVLLLQAFISHRLRAKLRSETQEIGF